MIEDMNRRPTKQNWVSSDKHQLNVYWSLEGFNNVWIFQGVGDIKYFMSVFKPRLSDNYFQERGARIESSSRAIHILFSMISRIRRIWIYLK